MHRAVERIDRSEPVAASPPPPFAAAFESARQPREQAQAPDGRAESAATAASVKDRWETRWRAAGAELKARAQHLKARSEAEHRAVPATFDSVPLKEPQVPRSQPGAVPRDQPPSRPIPTPAIAKVESACAVPEKLAVPVIERDVVGPATEISPSQIELAPNAFAESLEAAIVAHEIAARGQPELCEDPISACLTEPEAPTETAVATEIPAAIEQQDKPPILAEPQPIEPTKDAQELAINRNGSSSSRPEDTPTEPDPFCASRHQIEARAV